MPMQTENTFLVKMFQLFRNLFSDITYYFNFISLQCIVKVLYDFETLKTKELNTTLLNFSWFFCVNYKSNALTYKLF